MIRFYANGAADLGYKATVTYLTHEKSRDPELKVRNGCGGLVEAVGGIYNSHANCMEISLIHIFQVRLQ